MSVAILSGPTNVPGKACPMWEVQCPFCKWKWAVFGWPNTIHRTESCMSCSANKRNAARKTNAKHWAKKLMKKSDTRPLWMRGLESIGTEYTP